MSTDTKSSITLRSPSKYAPNSSSSSSDFTSPPLDWLHRTWVVTHSTLAMWRTARNVRITYKPLPPSPATTTDNSGAATPRVDDLVEYEKSSGKGGLKTVAGIDTACSPTDTGSWDWRGKGLLGFVTSHWEILGWGEREVPEGGSDGGEGGKERWVVTWFAPTLFTKEGLDLYSDRKGGMSPALAGDILAALKSLDSKEVVDMVAGNMEEVMIQLPWKES